MSKLIVVTGITGVQGGSVARTYLNTPGWKVRGVTRNKSSERAKFWASNGVEMVEANLDDISSLKSAFQGANIIFGVTDFWTIFKDPESMTKKKPSQDITEYCFEVELQQGKNLADSAASIPALERYIFSSMANAIKSSYGKYRQLYHMDSKAFAADYAKSLPGLNGKFSQIQAPIYFNLTLLTDLMKNTDGTYRIKGIGSGDAPIPFGHVAKDFGPCVRAVANAEPGINLFAVGEELSWNRYLDTWCGSQGVLKGGYDEQSLDWWMEKLPGLGREFGENVLFSTEFGYAGNDPSVIRPSQLGVKMTTFREYCAETDFSRIL
ncbi:NAD dependent epimerase/dehydratase, putative [Talaromyces stipitatus ATCC 10500]|uniref:NAD dependent epimerase/dehydratase, putative n=1 Tax=Talaromyces stipitatus (strain ATCC 10500 / CBS 375.48 / QM 6759 / NRRL 1006) TaxID=441959 RepID=B8MCV6_TALSN|nr:NAD dependent epimerase/dehydratase, putative [Talaromyces stipitatus ATCC 10500]EED17482.1 NAD dependent epimerase/dehydratase, putative [Talaromyces stipitatus ATCC 10500]